MKIKMFPHPSGVRGTSGIDRVVLAYAKHLPAYGIEIIPPESDNFDLVAGHVGAGATVDRPFVCHLHGLHWTADYSCEKWQYYVNAQIVQAIRAASEITVPSEWVAETLRRDLRYNPHVIPHGIDWQDWEYAGQQGDHVLWNKNRSQDVCDALPVVTLAQKFQRQHFVTTFLPHGTPAINNVNVLGGVIPHDQMKLLVQSCLVYLSTAKETWGIGVLEAMASGRPVLGFDWGGNSFLIEHGVNGYLAKVGDMDDLAAGLEYCVKHHKTLGANGRELAKKWTWEAACERVAQVYEQALRVEPPTVAVVIPCYNLADKLGRAIESVRAQTYENITDIIVVDDGSEDGGAAQRVTESFREQDERVIYWWQQNSGVATARNAGISLATSVKYISCLDADDAIAPEFIERCVRELEADRSLGIAYTGLHFIKPDGSEGLSPWPTEWDYDRQLTDSPNQIPTCCVFRRKMWERLGGYKSRYCPHGAGEEDAELWLRAGAYGYKAKRVTNKGLFIYSWQSGRVSGNPKHKRVDYTQHHPWAGKDSDGLHPFASYATPKRINGIQLLSHPVRQYDRPTISVVIPVGPGHEEKVINALDSLEAQTFRQWEVIVVDDCDEESDLKDILIAYPYVRYIRSGEKSVYENSEVYYMPQGAAYARNRGAESARAPLLVFLDADDWLYPRALEKMLAAWNEHQNIVYTDFTARTICNTEHKDKIEREGRLLAHLRTYKDDDGDYHLIVHKDQLPDFDCNIAQRQPKLDPAGRPYLWCNVTCLLPRAWHVEIGGFDEKMPSWEDVDYHWRLAKAGRCYVRIPEELMVYNFHQGHRRERGRQIHKDLIQYLTEKHKEIEPVGCRGCSRSKTTTVRQVASPFDRVAGQGTQSANTADEDFVLCRYISTNTGNHKVVGSALFDRQFDGFNMVRKQNEPPLWSIYYRYTCGGGKRKFLVHRKDIEARPDLFLPIEERQAVAVPAVPEAPLVEPREIAKQPLDAIQSTTSIAQAPSTPGALSDEARSRDDLPLAEPELIISGDSDESPGVASRVADDILTNTQVEPPDIPQPPVFELQKVPGITGSIATQLEADGHTTKEDILVLGIDGLKAYKGVGDARATMILRALSEK